MLQRSVDVRALVPGAVPVLVLAVSVVACQPSPSTDEASSGEATAAVAATPEYGDWGVELDQMDESVAAGDDFYTYVNGAWQTSTEIAADKVDAGPMTDLQDRALGEARAILEELAAEPGEPGTERQKLGDWYATMMDLEGIESLGLAPLQSDLERIAAITTREDLVRVLGANHVELGATPLSLGVNFDRKQIDTMVAEIEVDGISLPAREFYLEAAYEPLRVLFRDHVARLLGLAELDAAEARAERVLEIETRIAEVMWPAAELRDPRKRQNPTPTAELARIAPGIDWQAFLANAGLGTPERLNLSTPSAISGVTALIAEAPLEAWRDYLRYQLVKGTSSYLPKALRDENFAFYGKVLGGQDEPAPRWQVALLDLGYTSRPLSDPLGREFIARYVPANARPQAQAMIDDILAAFDARLAGLDWMTEETRAAAREKLSKVTIKPIFPDVWHDAEGLEVTRGDAVGNARRGRAFLRARDRAWIEEYPDRRLFIQPVFIVNAYALPAWNEVVFLAAIMRPPFFDPAADPAVNYGAMGAVIGHEISHLFDDQGRLTDGDGLLRDWWTEADAEQFVSVTDRLAEQVGSYEPLPGKKINGRLTLGESIADVAGLVVAHDAYRLSLGGEEPPVLDGFTADQRFFLAYAQMWRWKVREGYLDQLLKTDNHPPTNYRPRTVRNIDAWYEAFDIPPDAALYLPPEERINPW